MAKLSKAEKVQKAKEKKERKALEASIKQACLKCDEGRSVLLAVTAGGGMVFGS